MICPPTFFFFLSPFFFFPFSFFFLWVNVWNCTGSHVHTDYSFQVTPISEITQPWSITRCMVAERIGLWKDTLKLAGCGQPRTSQSLQVAVSPAPVCQGNVVFAVVIVVSSVWCEQLHFASCEGQKVDLSLNELEVLAQQIRADLKRIDGGTGTASSSHTADATAHECHGGHGQATHAGNPTERPASGGDERNLDGTQHEGVKSESRTVRVIGSKISPQGATLRRTTDVVENLRVPMESLPHRSGQEVSRAL